jgi:hypothetical protein
MSLPPMLKEALQTAGLLRSAVVTPLHGYFEPIRRPLAFERFPVLPVIRSTLLRRFLVGARRASPVA